ncbi:probable nuclear transport factor 2 isoform X1 [Procambarus clarkii]|uniref:probable nuclear transport factor 2 isoform X1 n=1 Tax=Procambarus clarkii TaxID=6728 RepID=UPI001E674EE5|nr:probable nuclear transport factor 2 isoform X1 [Procambarus clarkii]XP_045620459.1 probable nuclear transport factor 2 isoform X1 [Procambarus clarkii]
MTLNPQFQQIGETFVKQYYAIFDGEREGREKLVIFYHAELSLMSFEGVQVQGAAQILEKIKNLSFTKIVRAITTVDCQPTFDGGVLVNILGQLKMDDDPPHGFNQTFMLKPLGDSFFVQHDMFRLALHHIVV